MKHTDTTEAGLETLITDQLVALHGYELGTPADFDRQYALDWPRLLRFLEATQPKLVAQLNLAEEGPDRTKFLDRLSAQLTQRGVVDVLRHGLKHGPATIELYYGLPSPGNAAAAVRFGQNLWSVARQVRYSPTLAPLNALDLVLSLNGLPLFTAEIKNNLTGQTYADAVSQYQQVRDRRETLFLPGRCLTHFALDEQQVWMCAQLADKASWFLPFNQGHDQGAGNPPNPVSGLRTAYLWEQVLAPRSLADIIEHYATVVTEEDEDTHRKKRKPLFPRYHQLDVVRRLLHDAAQRGPGRRYLIQHSAGSGKSNSIAWLAHQLVELPAAVSSEKGPETEAARRPVFDTIIVVTDRRILDRQLRDTIRSFTQLGNVVANAGQNGSLRTLLAQGKKIVVTTVQKFPHVLDEIGTEHRGRTFAILIDEAHSSQGGRAAAAMNVALAPTAVDDDADVEDRINQLMAARKMLPNASYFAFTATPKNKTLEIFGDAYPHEGRTKHRPFHVYAMKQAIQEGFILDVLKYYTPVPSYYKLLKRIESDPSFDEKKASRKLRAYVEGHETAIRRKAELMVDHFHEQVLAHRKIGGHARAMVVCHGIARAIEYYHAFKVYLAQRHSPYEAIVAFTGEHEYGGLKISEDSLNGFPESEIRQRFQQDKYRFLIVADKFLTGFDQPLLHSMYVDKPLGGIRAVQTLSRLNRAHPKKHDTFVLDFYDQAEAVKHAFADYYQTTLLADKTDVNKLHDLQRDLDAAAIYSAAEVDLLVRAYLTAEPRSYLDQILDQAVERYCDELDEDGQVSFKGNAKAFVRTYGFLAAIVPYNNAEWEKRAIYLNFLIPKLPAPIDDDLSRGILETIDMDSYRAEVNATRSLLLDEADTEIDPVPPGGGGHVAEPELVPLSQIVHNFNTLWGNISFDDRDRIQRVLFEEIPTKVAESKAYQHAIKNSDEQNARIEHDAALQKVVAALLTDQTQLYKLFTTNPDFRKWLENVSFTQTYNPPPYPTQ